MITSACNVTLKNVGTLPRVDGAVNSWGVPLTVNLVSRLITEFTSIETLTPVSTVGVLQSYSTRELMVRPENERQFQWWMLHVKATETFSNITTTTTTVSVPATYARGLFEDVQFIYNIVVDASTIGTAGNFTVTTPSVITDTHTFISDWNTANTTQQIVLVTDSQTGFIRPQTITLSGGTEATTVQVTTPNTTQIIYGSRFNNDDEVVIDGIKYRIMFTNDYKLYGYYEYHMIEAYQEVT